MMTIMMSRDHDGMTSYEMREFCHITYIFALFDHHRPFNEYVYLRLPQYVISAILFRTFSLFELMLSEKCKPSISLVVTCGTMVLTYLNGQL